MLLLFFSAGRMTPIGDEMLPSVPSVPSVPQSATLPAASTVNEDETATVTAEDEKKSENVGSLPIIWSGKKNRQQREVDDAATVDFISLVKKHWSALNDKHTTKNDVWKTIAKELEMKYDINAENSVEKLRLKWRGLWNSYKDYVKQSEKTGSSVETLLDTPPFFDQIEDLVSSSKAVHPEHVSDSFSPKDQRKWSLAAFKARRQKAVKQQAGKVSPSTTSEISDGTTKNTDSPSPLPDDSGETASSELASGNSVKCGRRQSRHEQLVSILLSQNDKRKKEREDFRQCRQKLEEEKESHRAKRHEEKLAVANSLVETLRNLGSSIAKKRRKADSDSE